MTPTAIIVLDPGAFPSAQKLRAALPGAVLHGLAGRVAQADVPFSQTADHLRGLFREDTVIIAFCAAGIVIRSLAPVLGDKRAEPPVLAVSRDGQSVVPLLGGHHGANVLARQVAAVLDGHAALTTAGDAAYGISLDEPPQGWKVGNPEAAKPVMAALLAGQPVGLLQEAGECSWLSEAPFAETGTHMVLSTDRAAAGTLTDLVLHPPTLALGVGCARDCPPEELAELVSETLARNGLSEKSIALVASLDLKMDEPAVLALADRLDVPARFFTGAALEEQTPRLATPSEVVFKEVGCHGVSEGAALATVGEQGTLVVEKTKTANATCAIARLGTGIDARAVGRARGRLRIVGIGPGAAAWRTPAATRAVAEATDVVGYGLYLDLLGDLMSGKSRHESPLTTEEQRARLSLDLAAEGKSVALICSGDAGIYALATLVHELMEREDRDDWNRLDLAVEPGISALQAAAARIGAPINHDFCTISLSDLLTPWEDIERRLKAAAEGDFVVAFYNPVSKRRRTQLAAAREILLTGRPAETPVVLARNLGRAGEEVRVIPLGELTPDHADMLTMVLVGSSNSRHWNGRVYTPRGYARKMDPMQETGRN
ncbi:precorrin-3B C(17)-methyltransferase [Magnetospira sp. QH-2]|uniref:precorrin-3B C(17)-methyltransferase n=1 Tax=Magnetospira sp. (strain QH-2) TaxID=1288970 RepID=UPI0003E81511|nr:precorrin-3B C(17)-methyltransferase [Magnetospira sp. QH-2]CCQ72064.1 Precorrin-3B methylase [Magnetospira sp. QH-2]